MKTPLLAVLFVLIAGSVTSALAARIESTVTHVPANAETLLTVKAANFKQGWKVSADGSGAVAGPTVFKLGDNTGMVTLNVQAGPGPDGSFRLQQTFQVEVRKFQETVVVLQGISDAPVAASGKAAVAAVPTQGPDKLMGTLINSCKRHEVKYEFMFAGEEYHSETVAPGMQRRGIEVLRGTYKVRVFTRPYQTSAVVNQAVQDSIQQCKDNPNREGVMAAASRQKACEADVWQRASARRYVGGQGSFKYRDSKEAFAVTKDKWLLQFDCKDGG